LGNSVLLIILCGIFGFILGALLAVLVTGRGKSESSKEERSPAPAQRHPGEVRVWHEGALSRLLTEIDGQTFSNSKDISSEQRQRLVRLLRDWASWLEVTPQKNQQPGPVAAAAAASPVITPPASAAPVPPVAAAAVAGASPVKAQPASAARPAGDGKPATQASIVAQINDILQEMLLSNPGYVKGIRLTEDARNGVTVWVGLDHFNSIDSVSDPEALALIRAAVAEWERRAEGKGV
jgi:hypothetical protein